MKRIFPLLAKVATFSGLAVPSAAGAAPTVRHITIDEQFTGEFLVDACGYLGPVTIRVQGHASVVEFADPGRAPVLSTPFTSSSPIGWATGRSQFGRSAGL